MQDRTKNIIVTIGFIIVIVGIFFTNIIVKDKQISTTERRKLAQLPKLSFTRLLNGEVTSKWEEYAADQFVCRDSFRTLKSIFSINIFKQKDNNKLFVIDNGIYKIEYPLIENNVTKNTNKISNVYEKYLKDMNVYYAIVPDKNYYLENDTYLKIDYNRLKEIMESKLTSMKYIDIWNDLSLDDYYKTDLHWKQERLGNVVTTIRRNMNIESGTKVTYTPISVGDFYGTYYGQLGLNLPPDELYVLDNDTLQNCTTYNYETQKSGSIYEKTSSADKYDIYLSGATPLISILSPNSKTDKELLLFRDSFGSSLAPLLVEDYRKITLIDLRYISSSILGNYIEFKNQDVLFLYSTVILNQNVLK